MPELSTFAEHNKSNAAPLLDRETPVSLDQIRSPVAEDLDRFRVHFRDAMRTPVGLLDKLVRYLLRNKGKEVRPLLVLLSAKLCGNLTETSYRAAALVELLHSATLVHDDVVDDADQRRSAFSINALWKNKASVLFGDFLLSRGLLLALEHGEYDMLQALSDAVRRMSEGELLQIQKARLLDIDEETYFQIISDKTASLIAACTTCGALSATEDKDEIQRLNQVGEKLGLAFQIRDDLFDYGLEDVGKPIGIDLQEKKLTLPLIHALQKASWLERRRIMHIVRKGKKSKKDLKTVSQFTKDRGGLAYARRHMRRYAEEATSLLAAFPASDARTALMDLAAYTIQRKK